MPIGLCAFRKFDGFGTEREASSRVNWRLQQPSLEFVSLERVDDALAAAFESKEELASAATEA